MSYSFEMDDSIDLRDIDSARLKVTERYLKFIRDEKNKNIMDEKDKDKIKWQLDYEWPPEDDILIWYHKNKYYQKDPHREAYWGRKKAGFSKAHFRFFELNETEQLESNWERLMEFCKKCFESINLTKNLNEFRAFTEVEWGFWRTSKIYRDDLGFNTSNIKTKFIVVEDGDMVKNGNYGIYEIIMEEE